MALLYSMENPRKWRRKNPQLHVVLPLELAARIRLMAEAQDCSLSFLLKTIVREGLAARDMREQALRRPEPTTET